MSHFASEEGCVASARFAQKDGETLQARGMQPTLVPDVSTSSHVAISLSCARTRFSSPATRFSFSDAGMLFGYPENALMFFLMSLF